MTDSNGDLDIHQKETLRLEIVGYARKLLGIPYEYGAEWVDHIIKPNSLDCSELVEGVYDLSKLKMPDGSQNQYDFTIPTLNPQPADLAFFGKGGNIKKIYHVGLIMDNLNIIEARGYQPQSDFETGKVITRPRINWENFKPNFIGYRSHPKLI